MILTTMTAWLATVMIETWAVLGQMAPYLLFGFLIAGVLSVCISRDFVARHLGGRGFGPVLKASILGVPLPLCSCSVIPVSASIRRHGVSRAATTAFLLSTPQTGVDSIAVTYALLGPVFAVFRPIAALLTGLLGGLLVMLFGQPNSEHDHAETKSSACTEACCADRERKNILRRILEYGFVVLPRDIGVALLIGVVVAAVVSAAAPANQWQPYLGGGVMAMLLAMLLGVPVYVCASASVPIAVGLIHLGASPGTALAFLIAGPATNTATVAMVWRLLGVRSTVLYLATIVAGGVVCGLTLDWIMAALQATVPQLGGRHHETMAGMTLSSVWALLLLGVLGYSYFSRSWSDRDEHDEDADAPDSESIVLGIEGMTCNHCVETVARVLHGCKGVASVRVDLAAARAEVRGKGFDAAALIAAVHAIGYGAKPLL